MSTVSLTARLSANSNVLDICEKYNFSRHDLQPYISDDIIQITNVPIRINTKKKVVDWNSVRKEVKEIMVPSLKSDEKVGTLVAIARNVDGLANSITNAMVDQLKRQYDNQGFMNWLTQGTIDNEFHYFENIVSNEKEKANTECLEVIAKGQVECGQHMVGSDEIQLNITLTFRAITVRCNLIASDLKSKGYKVTGEQLMGEIRWNNIQAVRPCAVKTERPCSPGEWAFLAGMQPQIDQNGPWGCLGSRSHLAEGRGKSHRSPRVLYLGGLCGPETAKRIRLSLEIQGKRSATVPVLV